MDEAWKQTRAALQLQRERLRVLPTSANGSVIKEPRAVSVLDNAVRIAHRTSRELPGQRDDATNLGFEAAQLLQDGDVAATAIQSARRVGATDKALRASLRRQEDLDTRRRVLDAELLEALAAGAPGRAGAARSELRSVNAAASALSAEISSRFPGYATLALSDAVSLNELKGYLAPHEALLLFLQLKRDHYFDRPETYYAWMVRHDTVRWAEIDLAAQELDGAVRRLRRQLDPLAGESVDPVLAHRLYTKLLPFDRSLLSGVTTLLVVPDGSLESLPLSALVVDDPADETDPTRVTWLARRYATTTVPSVSSLRASRRSVALSRAAEPLRGIGDPVLGEEAATRRGVAIAPVYGTRGLADSEKLRTLPALPETADELRALAKTLGASDTSLLLRERATEAAVKAADLGRARIVAFATHAGVAGELAGLAEPALVLTPPPVASEEDDGLLTASEAATLDLDADFVILSACNTAAPDGTPGAPGLSGLAKSFLYAGTKALLVSHWAALSDAAERLTTGMLGELAKDPSIGLAEAFAARRWRSRRSRVSRSPPLGRRSSWSARPLRSRANPEAGLAPGVRASPCSGLGSTRRTDGPLSP